MLEGLKPGSPRRRVVPRARPVEGGSLVAGLGVNPKKTTRERERER